MATLEELQKQKDAAKATLDNLLKSQGYSDYNSYLNRNEGKYGGRNTTAIGQNADIENAYNAMLKVNDQIYSASFDAHNEQRKEAATILTARKAADTTGNAKAEQDAATLSAREAEDKRRRAINSGIGSTVLTSPLGLPPQPQSVKRKTLLGQ